MTGKGHEKSRNQTLKGTWHEKRKTGIHDLTIQSSQLQIFEGKSVKGKGNEKSRNLRLRSYHPKFIFEHPGVDFGIFYLGGPNI